MFRRITALLGAVAGLVLLFLVVVPSAAPTPRATPAARASAPPTPAREPVNQPLRALAAPADLFIGTAVNMDWLPVQAEYSDWIGTQFSSMTAESALKWRVVEPQRGRLDFGDGDALVKFARAHGERVRGHTLVWHDELPDWLTSGSFTRDQLAQMLHQHVIDEVSHFRGRIAQWDVVNEVLAEDGSLRDTMWLRALGPGYIADAFRWAHEADPNAQLFYNESTIETIGPKSDGALALVRQLRAQGVPIAGVGFQAHLILDQPPPVSLQRNLKRFSDLGVATEITEADVRMPLPPDPARLNAQAADYKLLLDACLQTPRCTGFTVWGFTDQHSWVAGGLFKGYGAADILDDRFEPKPAYAALRADLTAVARTRGDPITVAR